MSQFPQNPPPMGYAPMQPGMKPHRGTLILVLGILGLVVCVICGVIAWIMGNGDLREMREGRMDPSGMGLTNAGRICGMIGTILAIIGFVIGIIVVIAGAVAGAGAH